MNELNAKAYVNILYPPETCIGLKILSEERLSINCLPKRWWASVRLTNWNFGQKCNSLSVIGKNHFQLEMITKYCSNFAPTVSGHSYNNLFNLRTLLFPVSWSTIFQFWNIFFSIYKNPFLCEIFFFLYFVSVFFKLLSK